MDQLAPVKVLRKTIDYDDFTDGGSTAGTYTFTATDGLLPPNSIVLGWVCDTVTGFTGDTSATIQVGKSGTAAAFSTTTSGSIFTSTTRVGSFTVVATAHTGSDALAPLVTVTSASDFTSVAAGQIKLAIYYVEMAG